MSDVIPVAVLYDDLDEPVGFKEFQAGDTLSLAVMPTSLLAEVAAKADGAAVTAALALKADTSAVNASLATKADTSAVNSALALKADSSALSAGLALKADKTELTAGLALKANTSAVNASLDSINTELGLKATKVELTSGLALKADTSALGTAAERNVGTDTGQLGINGAFGWGGAKGQDTADCNGITICSVYRMNTATANAYPGKSSGDVLIHMGFNTVYASQLGFARSGAIWSRYNVNGTFIAWASHYTTRNTTVDANGFLKAASPVAKLSAGGLEGVGEFTRLALGHYQITQTQGLRLGGGWYLETPHDRNGNKYCNVEWYQNFEPPAVDGYLDEPVEGVVLEVHCFERVWNPALGLYENGAPMDIPEGRWIDLRFNEVRVADDEDDFPIDAA